MADMNLSLSEKLDKLLHLSKVAAVAQRIASENLPDGPGDDKPLEEELAVAKKAFLEDCLSKSETLTYLHELHANIDLLVETERKVPFSDDPAQASRSLSSLEGGLFYTRLIADAVKLGVARPENQLVTQMPQPTTPRTSP